MVNGPGLRVALGIHGVSIWSAQIFGQTGAARVREFLGRVLGLEEVDWIELRRASSFVHVRYRKGSNRAAVLRKLSRALRSESPGSNGRAPDALARQLDVESVFLAHATGRVRVHRVGATLSTWRPRQIGRETLSLFNPILRNRRDVAFRLEEELSAILGVRDFRVSPVTAGVWIEFDSRVTTAERVVAELELAWPRLVDGLAGPPARRRLFAAVGLFGLAYTGQYVAPALRPLAVAGVAVYGFPNVVNGVQQLRRGRVGLPALYSTGLALMLFTGLPFTAAMMAVFMQAWPQLARRKLVSTQRRIFSAHRRRPAWALRVDGAGHVTTPVRELRLGDVIVIGAGERVPVDGVVVDGGALVAHEPPLGAPIPESRSIGAEVAAGALVTQGKVRVRVERAGPYTAASRIDSFLPHGEFVGLPASHEAERVANRNAKPALAIAALNLLVTRTLPPSQGTIRPDYATGLRLSAQLAALQGIARGWQKGLVFRNPAALDRLAAVQICVIDESAGPGPALKEVSTALRSKRKSPRLVYVSSDDSPRVRALSRELDLEYVQGLSPSAKTALLRRLGNAVLWVGDGSVPGASEWIAASVVSYSVAPLPSVEADAADVLGPHRGLSGLLDLLELGRTHSRALSIDYATLYAANLLGVAGAFLAALSPLRVALLSNIGTGLIYARHAIQLDRLATEAEERRARFAGP